MQLKIEKETICRKTLHKKIELISAKSNGSCLFFQIIKYETLPTKLLLFFSIITIGYAQKLHGLPNLDNYQLTEGWQKFIANRVIFDVEVIAGDLSKGTITWLDGSSYSGDFHKNSITGKGTYTWPNGMRHEGSFKKSMRHGRGSFILQNGSKWSGKWKNNKRNGKGKIFNSQGEVVKKGLWIDGVLQEEKIEN